MSLTPRGRIIRRLGALQFNGQRTAQLIFNALDQQGLARWPSGEAKDIFYIEDEVLANALEEYKP